jgi:methylenetetrahydrofolate dehydrogenase (NADP+)/methenyltetrahydrofolate cyclohydrolase
MSAVMMDGKALAEKIKGEIASQVLKMNKKPALGTILVGSD